MDKLDSSVDILLATYNGARYLREQIESILVQTYPKWRVLIHDDGSTDDTLEIGKCYASRYPEKIKLVEDRIQTGGAKNNFAHLMSLSNAEYISFCDQDDIWLPNKIEISLAACRKAEENFGRNLPIGVFTDLAVVDSDLNLITRSLWEFQGTEPSLVDSIERLALRNCVTGCTLFINRVALLKSLPIPKVATMHDWWISLIILKNGGLLCPIRDATVLYRQHGGNTVGAKGNSFYNFLKRIISPVTIIRHTLNGYKMARYLDIYKSLAQFSLCKAKELIASGVLK